MAAAGPKCNRATRRGCHLARVAGSGARHRHCQVSDRGASPGVFFLAASRRSYRYVSESVA